MAETKKQLEAKGRAWRDSTREETVYAAGWADFVEYRANGKV